uniref:Putative secreted protein n=1 Tax=Anopheles marajoara TaxID=58244 RepID=A0A2M4C759_9DIPT
MPSLGILTAAIRSGTAAGYGSCTSVPTVRRRCTFDVLFRTLTFRAAVRFNLQLLVIALDRPVLLTFAVTSVRFGYPPVAVSERFAGFRVRRFKLRVAGFRQYLTAIGTGHVPHGSSAAAAHRTLGPG